ncbi:DNA-binding protein [Pandoraea horticolens]|uniref:DNA-binding protein n=1 Tax=Pandoraea horticolens TaxID=2508298 RepID=A0A5E4XJ89_9BURK|nr:helix-turn-helix domain-containing protein [Pandoraea horticolens]VVE36387.1 DNA-binding protein [Pandoraea horticolens]
MTNQQPASPLPKLYRVAEVTKLLSVSRATVYRLIAAEKLKLVKISTRSSGITAASIEALLAGNAAQ